LDAIERQLDEAKLGELPWFIGKLEVFKARALARLTQPTPLEPPISSDTHDHYTAEGLAQSLSLPKSTVYKLYRTGAWPNAYKMGKTKGLRIPRADVVAWQAKRALDRM
jgi:excisionase family DNA binding protein